MDILRRPVGIAVLAERPLAGRIVGWMFIVGAILTTLLPLLPGPNGKVLTPTLSIGVAAAAWGIAAIRAVDWRTAPGWVIHASVVTGALGVAVATHDTGGAESSAGLLFMLPLVFAAYYFAAREAWPYLGLVLVLYGLPLAYDSRALDSALIDEMVILAPCYWLLAFLLIAGKRGMVAAQARADELARTDPLTGLANRRALLEAMAGAGGRMRDESIGLLMLDVDDFKGVNTRLGHPGGDRALVFIAECLRTACRAGDLPARLGGDEFAVLVRGGADEGMSALADRLLETVRVGDSVRISVGWAAGTGEADALLTEADIALAEAKRRGKDRAMSYG